MGILFFYRTWLVPNSLGTYDDTMIKVKVVYLLIKFILISWKFFVSFHIPPKINMHTQHINKGKYWLFFHPYIFSVRTHTHTHLMMMLWSMEGKNWSTYNNDWTKEIPHFLCLCFIFMCTRRVYTQGIIINTHR